MGIYGGRGTIEEQGARPKTNYVLGAPVQGRVTYIYKQNWKQQLSTGKEPVDSKQQTDETKVKTTKQASNTKELQLFISNKPTTYLHKRLYSSADKSETAEP